MANEIQKVYLSSVDSTAKYLEKYVQSLGQDASSSICVVADEQRQGHGRHGTAWESPKGNFYLSFFAPSTIPMPQASEIGTVSLLAAIGCQTAIQQVFGLQVAIKWPNDLTAGSSKIGGILGEAILSGQDVTGLKIGIGLNVSVAPKVERSDYSIGCLSDFVRITSDASAFHKLREDFIHLFWQTFVSLLKEGRSERLAKLRRTFGKGHTWWSPESKLFSTSNLTDSGELRLTSREDQEERLLSADDHGYMPITMYKKKFGRTRIVVDIGNTNLKIAKIAHDLTVLISQTFELKTLEKNGFQTLLVWIEEQSEDGSTILFYSSVNPPIASQLEELFAAIQICGIRIEKKLFRLKNTTYDLASMGMDRLCLIEGYLKDPSSQDKTALLVSLGTATTLDIVRKREHLGGLIFPGLKSMIQALESDTNSLKTSHLLELSVDRIASSTREKLGTTTDTAILRGTTHANYAVIEQTAAHYGVDEVVLTGGFCELFKNIKHSRVDSDLILKGIWILSHESI